jgi:hypothetical protein
MCQRAQGVYCNGLAFAAALASTGDVLRLFCFCFGLFFGVLLPRFGLRTEGPKRLDSRVVMRLLLIAPVAHCWGPVIASFVRACTSRQCSNRRQTFCQVPRRSHGIDESEPQRDQSSLAIGFRVPAAKPGGLVWGLRFLRLAINSTCRDCPSRADAQRY